MNVYTRSERTVKKYTVHQAYESAKRRCDGKSFAKNGICINAISGRAGSEKITLEELNELSDAIYNDTLYHGGG